MSFTLSVLIEDEEVSPLIPLIDSFTILQGQSIYTILLQWRSDF